MYFTYILKSTIAEKTYVGYTNNVKKRLLDHNKGKGTFTTLYKPWEIVHVEIFDTLEKAVQRERYFKSAAGRRWTKKNLFNI